MSDPKLPLRLERQQSRVADEVSAVTAVVRPILAGVLLGTKARVLEEAGGHNGVKLKMLARLRRAHDGECGMCFEYAVHDALNRNEPTVADRLETALHKHCKVSGSGAASILFGAEKSGAVQLIDTSRNLLTDDSTILVGAAGRPAKLKKYINQLAAAFRRPTTRLSLPYSISGLWKADLFIGATGPDRWVGTTVKINESDLEAARGLRIGIVPSKQGRSDKVRIDDSMNLVVCPLPYDGAFMEVFYQGWQVVQQFLAADAMLPKESALPQPALRQVASYLHDRREFPVVDVLDALGPLAQPELIRTEQHSTDIVLRRVGDHDVTSVIAPVAILEK